MKNTENIQKLKEIINNSNKILFFTGAGVSTLSGIPDFRSANGLYNNHKYRQSPEIMLSRNFFFSKTEEFYRFYKDFFDVRKFEPNIVHKKIAELENAGKCVGVITQNVDGLHTKAGSRKVVEYHGSIYRNKCRNHTKDCPDNITADYVFDSTCVPRCPHCNAIVKPDITLYQEVPQHHNKAVGMIVDCDVMIVCGTSLSVYPAANFIEYLTDDKKLIIINRDETNYDNRATLCIHEELGEVFSQI